MKKWFVFLLYAAGCAAVALSFAACGGGDEGGKTGDSHTVTCVSGEYYDLTSATQLAPEGTEVTVHAEPEPFVRIDGVFANGVGCEEGEAGVYTFVMPDEDVTVTAEISAAPEIPTAEDGMYWVTAPAAIAAAQEQSYGAVQEFEISFGADPVNNSIDTDGHMIYAEVFSTDETVIPAEAISGIRPGNDNVYAYSGSFTVDLSMLSAGTTTLVFTDTDNGRMITKNITVVSEGELFKGDVWTVEIAVDLSGIKAAYGDENFRLHVGDEEYLYGSAYPQYQNFDFTYPDSGDEVTYQVQFVKGQAFTVWVGYETINDYGVTVYMPFAIESGVGADDSIDFSEDGGKITLVLGAPEE